MLKSTMPGILAFCWALCLHGQEQSLAPAVDPALVAAVERRGETLKERLQQQYGQEDWRILCRSKEAVDFHFLPLFVAREVLSAEPWLLGRALMHDYSARPLVASPDELARLREFGHRFPGPNPQCGAVSFRAVTRHYNAALANYAVAIAAEGCVSRNGDAWVASSWYEPCWVNRELDYPVNPAAIDIEIVNRKMRFFAENRRDVVYEECLPAGQVCFNNPAYSYLQNDSLRLWDVLAGIQVTPAAVPDGATSAECLGRVFSGGEIVRSYQLQAPPAGTLLQIRQFPVRLQHAAPTAFCITETAGTQVLAQEEFQPRSEIPYLTGGREIAVWFAKDPTTGWLIPTRGRITADGRPVAEVAFEVFSFQQQFTPRAHQADPAIAAIERRLARVYAAIDARAPERCPRRYSAEEMLALQGNRKAVGLMLKVNAFGALAASDLPGLQETLRAYRALLHQTQFPELDDMAIGSVEALVQTAFDFLPGDVALQLCREMLLPLYSRCGPEALRQHVARLMFQGRAGFAYLAVTAATGQTADGEQGPDWAGLIKRRLEDPKFRHDALCFHRFSYAEEKATANRAIIDHFRKDEM